MWVLRPFQPKDWAAVRELHEAAGATFEIPRRLEEVIVVEDEETKKIVMVTGTRVTREAYVWVDHGWKSPALRWRIFCEAHEEIRRELERKGIDDVHIWVEPAKNGKDSGFARRLIKKLGWFAPKWNAYSLKIRGKNG